jgi:hypothetical protein
MRTLVLSSLALAALILMFTGCTSTTYWSRPGAKLDDLADESHACYAAAVGGDNQPAAFAAESRPPLPRGGRLLPPTEPPPKLWARAPREAGFERFDEQLRYERCMERRGWRPTRA